MPRLLASGVSRMSNYCIFTSDLTIFKDIDAEMPTRSLIVHQFAVLGMAYAAELFERISCLYGILWPPKDFFIVRKGPEAQD